MTATGTTTRPGTAPHLPPRVPALGRARHVPVTWDELLRLPDRQLRRVLSDRYQSAARAERIEDRTPMGLPPAVWREWRREVARLNGAATEVYEAMLAGYPERARAQYAARQQTKGSSLRPAPLDDWKELVVLGESPARALERLGTTHLALERAAYRHDRHDVLQLLGIHHTRQRQEATSA